MIRRFLSVCTVSIVALAGCVSNPTATESVLELEPIPATASSVGDSLKFVDQVGGTEMVWTVTEINGDQVEYIDNEGCSWTTTRGDLIRPSLVWKNCGDGEWATGGTDAAKIKGTVWPMMVGNKVTYSQIFYNSKGGRSDKHYARKCKVAGTESIEIGEAALDTYKVTCTQNYSDKLKRTYWFAPGHGLVKRQTGSERKPTENLVRVL